jgi:hypothetical protein
LIKSGSNQVDSTKLIEYLEQLSALVQSFGKSGRSNDRSEDVTRLPSAFVDAMKKSAKQGIRSAT